ncbi:hypothetical protein B0J17DRAFT_771150 [Rhizoctonia solani]|nr:hypothetical protein B0J17DRAFT_771150 [Rhizoctonia solani]
MAFKRILNWRKKKKGGSEGRGSPSGADTPAPEASTWSLSPTPVPSIGVSALVFQPSLSLPESPHVMHQAKGALVTAKDSWVNLTALLNLLKRTTSFSPLTAAIDDLSWFVRAHDEIGTTQREYQELCSQLEAVFQNLHTHFSAGTPPEMTIIMWNLCESIRADVRQVYHTQDRSVISRYIQAAQDVDKVTACYRRMQVHLQRVALNASLHIWTSVDRQTTEAQLHHLSPSMPARYNSVEARVVQRRECTPNTRQQVLIDLKLWIDQLDGEKVCWINGMAGTGKTTIINTLCSTLDKTNGLGASFFCTRLIPECRDIKLILPTIAYQLARFSDPFRGALLQVLKGDPDVHTKVLQVQFTRMILEPLRQVESSLPPSIVVVIDALDECEDDDGVGQVLEVIFASASELPIKFLVSSRPEYHIREKINKSALKKQLILHELDENIVKADIETYLRTELAAMSVPFSSSQLAVLVDRAGVLFIYAATAIRYIKGRNAVRRLETILQVRASGQGHSNQTREIDRLYELALISALNDQGLEPIEREQIELVLHTVVCAQQPLTVHALAGLLGLSVSEVAAALEPLWSVLHISESKTDQRVSTLHASFPDFMLDSGRSKQFACNAHVHNGKLAELCFRRIRQNPSQFNICSLQSSYLLDEDIPGIKDKVRESVPLDLLYVCKYWAAHLSLGGMSDELAKSLHDFLSTRLLLWMEVLNLAKQIYKGIGSIQKAINWLKAGEQLESIMPLARDARRFVTLFATSPVSRSTPHLYVSMLSSWPNHQRITSHYSRQAVGLVRIKGLQTAERQIGLLSLVPAGSSVFRIAYSPNGDFFAAGTTDGRVLIWDATSCRMTIEPIKVDTNSIPAIAISPDGTRICSSSHNRALSVWDPQNGQRLAGPLSGHADFILSVDYSPDGQWLASGSLDGTVFIWSTETWERAHELVIGRIGHGNELSAVAFSPDGSFIATSFESAIHLWDPFNNRRIGQPLEGHTSSIPTLAFLKGGKHLASGSCDHSIRIWNIGDRQIAFGLPQEHTLYILSLAVSPDGKLLASASDDHTMRIWDTTTWQTRAVLQHTGHAKSVTFSPDGSQLVSSSIDGNIRVWDVDDILNGQQTHSQSQGHSNAVLSVAFSPCGAYFVSGSHDMTVCIWDSQSRQLLHSPLKGHNEPVLSVGVSADSSHIFSVSMDRMIYVWHSHSGKLEYKIGPIETDGDYEIHYQLAWPAAYIFHRRLMVCGSKSGRIYVWEESKLLYSRTGHNSPIFSIAFSPDGQSFVSGSEDGEVMIWDTASGNRLFDPCKGHSEAVLSIAFSPDGTRFASGSFDCTIHVWSMNTGSQVGDALQGHTRPVCSVAFSPRGDQLVSGSDDKTLRLWNIASGKTTAIFRGHTDQVISVAFSPDGTQVVSGSNDKTIRLWKSLPTAGDLTSDGVRSEDPLKDLTNVKESKITPEWEMDHDGWVHDCQGRLLVWVPPDLRSILLAPRNAALLSGQGHIELDFSDARIGDMWETCYQPYPSSSSD